jgi:hypothetical protein
MSFQTSGWRPTPERKTMTNLITELAEQYVAEFPNERLDGEWSANLKKR